MVVPMLSTTVGSILATWLLPIVFNSKPPFGAAADVLVGTVAAVVWAVVAYSVVSSLIGLTERLKQILSASDAIGLAAIMLWVLRRIKR